MIPLYCFLRGDTIGLLMLADPHETVASLAEKLQASAAVRVPRRPVVSVIHKDRVVDPRITVAQAGLTALDRVDVVPA